MTTEAAFKKLFANRARCEEIGMSSSNYRLIKYMMENDDPRLTDRLRVLWLDRAGFRSSLSWTDPGGRKTGRK